MSEAGKPTPGIWSVNHGNSVQGWTVTIGDGEILVGGKGVDSFSNAALIAEAGTVHHETGLTPRQLVYQRDALAKALEFALRQNEHDMLLTGDEIRMGRLSLALVKGEPK